MFVQHCPRSDFWPLQGIWRTHTCVCWITCFNLSMTTSFSTLPMYQRTETWNHSFQNPFPLTILDENLCKILKAKEKSICYSPEAVLNWCLARRQTWGLQWFPSAFLRSTCSSCSFPDLRFPALPMVVQPQIPCSGTCLHEQPGRFSFPDGTLHETLGQRQLSHSCSSGQ